ncbi:hypothetical protein ACQZ45_25560 [Agrobacterium sp. 16-2014-1-2a]
MSDVKPCNGLIAQLSNPVKAAEKAIEEYEAEEGENKKAPFKGLLVTS